MIFAQYTILFFLSPMSRFSLSENPQFQPFKRRDQFLPKKSAADAEKRELDSHDQLPLDEKEKNGWMATDPGYQAYAIKFLSVELNENPDEQLVQRAAFQNRITRAFFSKEIGNMANYRKRLTSSIADFCSAANLPNMSQDLARVFDGIEPAIYGIEEDKRDFSNRPNPQPGEKQFIGLNDILDAHHSIDYIDLRMSADGKSPIAPVSLVQVKRGLLSPEDIAKIHQKHQEYVNGLVPERILTDRSHSRQEDYLASELFKKEMTGLDQESRDAFLVDKWNVFFSELSKLAEADLTESSFQQLSEKSQIPVAFLKIMIQQSDMRKLNDLASSFSAAHAIDAQKLFSHIDRVKQYAEKTGLSKEDYQSFDPEWTPSPTLLQTLQFESVIWHNGQRIKKTLTANTALTIH